jgi:hypothetical protein
MVVLANGMPRDPSHPDCLLDVRPWLWGAVRKHIGWRHPRPVASLSYLLPNVNRLCVCPSLALNCRPAYLSLGSSATPASPRRKWLLGYSQQPLNNHLTAVYVTAAVSLLLPPLCPEERLLGALARRLPLAQRDPAHTLLTSGFLSRPNVIL